MSREPGATVPWENMPRRGRTLESTLTAPLQQLGILLPGARVTVSVEDVAERGAVFGVPAFFRIGERACCLFREESVPEDITDIVESIVRGRATLTATFKAFPTYPVVALLIQVPLMGDPLKSEAVPDLTNADVRDALDSILNAGAGDLYFLVGDKPRIFAKGQLAVASRTELKRCLDAASTHYHTIDADSLDHVTAAREYFRTTPL